MKSNGKCTLWFCTLLLETINNVDSNLGRMERLVFLLSKSNNSHFLIWNILQVSDITYSYLSFKIKSNEEKQQMNDSRSIRFGTTAQQRNRFTFCAVWRLWNVIQSWFNLNENPWHHYGLLLCRLVHSHCQTRREIMYLPYLITQWRFWVLGHQVHHPCSRVFNTKSVFRATCNNLLLHFLVFSFSFKYKIIKLVIFERTSNYSEQIILNFGNFLLRILDGRW